MIRLTVSVLLLGILAWSTDLSAQVPTAPFALSLEFQAYPTGLIPGVRLEYGLKTHHSLHLRAGYNWVRHRDLGVHDNEQGGGIGCTLGYRYHFRNYESGWFLGARADQWSNTVDWQDKNETGAVVSSGTSKILVFQPTAEAGYCFALGKNHWFLAPTLAFGAEINVITHGAPVGEGTILLLGINLGKRFGKATF